jgi:formylglycine-generating enzyme required for sulfatase activity
VPPTGPTGFTMGANVSVKTDTPHRVVLTKPFCMDATEVTVHAYQQCVDAGRCDLPRAIGKWQTYPTQADYPVNKVNWKQAKSYCEFRAESLPTEAQWEWAATGGDGRKWPWGDEPPDCTRADYTPSLLPSPSGDAGCHGGGPSAVGSHPAGDKVWRMDGRAIHDLAGNLWEWCLDNYMPYTGKDETDPLHLVTELGVHVVRGGGWNRSARGILSAFRGGAVFGYQVPGLGFRCVRNPA